MTATASKPSRSRPCGSCERVALIVRRAADGLPDICMPCYKRLTREGRIPSRLKRCDVCGEFGPLVRRGDAGTPSTCERCYQEPQDTCTVCQRVRPCLRAQTTRAVCRSCVRRARRGACQDCGREREIHNRLNGKPQCAECRRRDLAQNAECQRCGQQRRLTRITGLEGLCESCAGITSSHVCSRCASEEHLYARGLCARCVIVTTLEPHVATADAELVARLGAYLDALAASTNPRSTIRWIQRSVAYQVLLDILHQRVALSHEALDALTPSQAIEHLRRALVSHHALPCRDEALQRFSGWLDQPLAQVNDPGDRQRASLWARWHLFNELNYRSRRGQLNARSIYYARSQVTQAVAFLNWLNTQGATLSACRQHHVDDWFSTRSTTSRRVTSLLRWAQARGVSGPLSIPSVIHPTVYRTLTDDQRLSLIARLARDEDMDLRDRVAGLLVLLYGQPIARIARLRIDDIDHTETEMLLRLGTQPVVIVEPLATLLKRLAQHPPRRGVTAAAQSSWLFPGKLAGEPLRPERLQQRLRDCGIKGIPSRTSAVLQLAREVPTPVLAETLGYNYDLAATWARLAAADYAAYAASRA